jgi:PAS domain S-box-containing protein
MNVSALDSAWRVNEFEAVQIVDLDNTVVYISPACSKLTGWAPEEVVGRKWQEVFAPDAANKDGITPVGQAISEKPDLHNCDGKLKTRSGEILDVCISTSSLSMNGKRAGVVVTTVEMSAKGSVQSPLLSKREFFSSIIEASPIGIALLDCEGKLVFSNQAGLDIYGIADIADVAGYPILNDAAVPPSIISHLQNREMVRFENLFDFDDVKKSDRFKTSKSGVVHHDVTLAPIDPSNRSNSVGFVLLVQDITPRKQIENALRESEHRFREIMEKVNLIGVSIDTNGNITFVNDYLLELSGWTREEAIGKNWFKKFLPSDQYEMVYEVFSRLILTGEMPVHFENEIITRTGQRHIVSWNNIVLRDNTGKVIGTSSLGEDVTDRKETEAALKESEEKFRKVFENSPIGIAILDGDGRIVDGNASGKEIYGLSGMEDVKGFNVLKSPNMPPNLVSRLATGEVVKQEQVIDFDLVKQRDLYKTTKSGLAYHDLTIAPMGGDIQDNPPGFIFLSQDITERKKNEIGLRKSEARYRTLVESQVEAVCRFLPDLTLTFVNEMYCRLYGKSREELIGKKLTTLVPKRFRLSVKEYYQTLTEKPGVSSYEMETSVPNGEVLWFLWIDSPIFDSDGQLTEFQSVGRDITKRKMIEETLLESEEKFRKVFENAGECIALIAIKDDGSLDRFIDFNDATCKLLGYTREELLALPPERSLPSEASNKIIQVTDVVRSTGRSANESTFITKSGRHIPVEFNNYLFEFQGEEVLLGIARDITERKTSEEALRDSEEKFRSIFENASDAIFLAELSSDGVPIRILEANAAATRILGYSHDELLGFGPLDLITGLSSERAAEVIADLRFTGHSIYESQAMTKNGEAIDFDISLHVFRLKGLDVIIAIVRDITSRKKLEKAIVTEHNRAQLYLDTAPAMIGVLDTSARVTMFNRKSCEVTGYSPEEIIGKDYYDTVVPESDRERRRKLHAGIISGEMEPASGVAGILVNKSGEERLILMNSALLRDDEGKVVEVLYTGEDITDQVETEKALIESEKKFRSLFDNSTDAIFLLELSETYRPVRCVDVNAAASKILGYSRDELLVSLPMSFVVDLPPDEFSTLTPVLVADGSTIIERRMRTKSGEVIDAEIALQMYKLQDSVVCLSVIRDITSRKKMEKAFFAEQHRAQT